MARRLLIAVLLCCASSLTARAAAAGAGWTAISEGETATAYVDAATIRRSGRKASMWELTDYHAAPDPDHPYLSVKRFYEFDCDELALRTLSITTYAGHMGGGEVVLHVAEPAKWFLLVFGTVGDRMWKLACGRR